jgi:hypothetical protein
MGNDMHLILIFMDSENDGNEAKLVNLDPIMISMGTLGVL